jgi:hypothetical protein
LKYVDPSGEFVEMTNPQGILYNWGSKRILAFFSEVYVTFDLTGKQNVFLIHAENEAQLYRTVEEVNAINDISPIIADTDELKHISVASNLQDGDLGRANRLFGSIELADPPTALAHELPHFSPAQRAMKNVEAEYDSSLFSAFISKRRGRSLDMHEQMALRAYEADDLEIWKRYYYQETSWPASYGEVIPLRYQRFGAIKDLASRVANSRFGRATTRIGRATTRILGQALPNDINTVLGLTPTPPNIPLPGMTANQMARARA